MARAARNARRQAARLGLLTAWALAACAVMQDPPGGPPDFAPPTIVAIAPDSGSVAPQFDGRLRFQFDEVINEQSGGGLAKLIELSPRTPELDVSWKRTAIEVKPASGWRANAVYRVVLLPGVADLRNNRMEAGRTVVFSTGGEIPATRLTGVVLDWENGRVGQRALVEAVLLPDSLV
ncbi:MAG: Ig-like domain-containing protein, partial [Gemmatimonadota bacterium]|nr:Ig-like domain-containing protein [Gemmatimonadota bacterium]